ncbi:MAG: YajQ family cyclic di-GMP-binding protein [Gammaproteobacteria bacterium]|nr:MAG: YajQ family cyclic di-GMP-binding protein [Gammaproteobacteria bacterium]
MPSFDVVSEVDMHELANALDQANREVGTRYDFKGANASFSHADGIITMESESDFQLGQMLDILYGKCSKRGVDLGNLEPSEPEISGQRAIQRITVRQGIETELGKKIVKLIKAEKLKVQATIQGDQVRVSGKKRDDLQSVIALLKQADLGLPLQFTNFRD